MVEATPNAPAEQAVNAVKMELKRNYVPLNLISIVGHQRVARVVKNSAGEKIVAEPERFVEGEMYPAAFPGVGFKGKIWAGTVIEVPEDEARTMRKLGIAEAYI